MMSLVPLLARTGRNRVGVALYSAARDEADLPRATMT